MLYVIQAKHGGIVGINCFTSKQAAEIAFKEWHLDDYEGRYEIVTLYPVDLDCVKSWASRDA